MKLNKRTMPVEKGAYPDGLKSRHDLYSDSRSCAGFRRNLLSTAIVCLLSSASAVAQEDMRQLETIRVLGQAEAGFNISLTDDLIDTRQALDLEDMLNHDPSITVGGGAPIAQKIYVRGLEDTLLNVSIDGATQAGYLYHHQGRIHVEPELIKDVVIKPGAGNAADGAGALGGAIHFNLKDAQDLLLPGQTMGALVKAGIYDNNDGFKSHLSAYGMLNESFGLMASFTDFSSDDDYKDGDGDRVDETEQSRDDVRIRLSGDLGDGHFLSISYEDFNDEGRRYARANMGDIGFHPVYPNIPVDQKTYRESTTIAYRFNPADELINLSTTVYTTDSAIEKNGDEWATAFPPPGFVYGDVYGDWHGGGVESLGLDIRNISQFDTFSLEYGIEYRDDEAYLINPLNPFNDEQTTINALFVQAEIELAENLKLSTGARYDDYDYTDNNDVSISDSKISPNATLSYDVNESLEISLGYAKAFKGVSSPEVFFLENGTFGAGQTLSSYQGADTTLGAFEAGELKGEEADNTEIAFKYRAGQFAASGEFFQQTIKNAQAIDSRAWARLSYKDDVKVDGYAFRVAYFMDDMTFNAGVAHSKPELDGEPLSSGDMGLGTAYGRTWTLGLDYDFSETILMGWDARVVETLTDVQDGQDDKKGYAVHDVFVQWKPTENLTAGIAINNLFDKFYYDQGTFYTSAEGDAPFGLPEPGRDIRLYASYKF